MRILSAAALAALALAGCSDRKGPAPETSASEAPASSPAAPAPSASPAGGAAASKEIPVALQGRWGLAPADCTSTRGDAKGLLTIGPDTLEFYESRAKLGQVKERDESRIRADFQFVGEGMSWSRDEGLEARDDGKTLIRREYGKDAAPDPLRYTRCP